ncbi:major facilitator superfamily transporter [Neoasaia chiangmaiensis NBRC 101099]|uniref:Bcr/CflA family efflux transporter n=1 Tax=Neoasaia chiangmaiensis TaxID=320497 RepID=A0A1U9KLJ8_9PROT|nr:multidrug effflux MFS transporter [Neoasaia chiangmaiensis]AQS86667.1 Bcr/CflA family drug resistance efflux transporter [Neoasaia chiangmaiensis]GBR41355.1 major facilitator superfamily transporter [Neoasaia chiangmaiensis NBRC 101099]GEN16664.1 Bcr/CflA family drug resistance efflux transporter [Neoasaia chiangmaiensis]
MPEARIPDATVLSRRKGMQQWHILVVLSVLMGFASISTDFYLPAMPEMARSLSASAGQVALTVSGYLAGFSLGQLFWGPVGDRYGRRLPIAVGLAMFTCGSAGCALSSTITTMIIWRVVQAVGACASVVLARAMVRDLYHGARATQMLSTLMTIMAIAPLIAPLLGGQILQLSGWRAIFWILVVVGILTSLALFSVPETLSPEKRHTDRISNAFLRYGALLRQPRLLGYAGSGGCFYAGMFAYISGSPFAYITYHHVPETRYGLLFGASIIGIMLTNQINARLAHRLGSDCLLKLGCVGAMLAAIMLMVTSWLDLGGLWGLAIPLFFYVSMAGFIIANSLVGALHDHSGQAGTVSALVGAVHYGSGIAGSALVGFFADGTPVPMSCIIAITSIAGFLFLILIRKVKSTLQ